MASVAVVVLLAHVAVALALGWAYFRRCAITRPPIGVINRADVALMSAGVVLVPYLYLALPRWLAMGMLAVGTASAIYLTCEAATRRAAVAWPLTLALLGTDIAAAWRWGATSGPGLAANNVALLVAAVGIANLWAQGGLRARDLAVLAGFLAGYDLVATVGLPLMGNLVGRLAGLPFAPVLRWPIAGGDWLGLGLGDVLLATVFPLVIRRAYGRTPALVALALALATPGILLSLAATGVVRVALPAMVALGPVIILTILVLARRYGPERTTRRYWLAEMSPDGVHCAALPSGAVVHVEADRVALRPGG